MMDFREFPGFLMSCSPLGIIFCHKPCFGNTLNSVLWDFLQDPATSRFNFIYRYDWLK